jgi:TPR repeat protein
LDALPDQELATPRYIHAIQALADDESDDAAIARAKDQLQRLASEGYNPARVSFAELQLETAAEADDPRRKDLAAESVRLLTAAAEQDCVDAQLELVAGLREGAPGIDADADTAESWRQRAMQCLEKRTQSHDLVAQLLLADLQLGHAGDAATRRRGLENLFELALVGVSAAQFRLGQVFLEGDGVEVNPKRGNTYLRLAAEQGHADAQYELGISYRDGRGATANRVEAARWFQQAAEQNHAAALEALADAFADGEGVPQDEDLASELRELAAEAEPDA